MSRTIWVRPSSANLWAGRGGCWASATYQPPAKGETETEHTLRGTRLHEAVASIIDPSQPRPRLEKGEWSVAQGAVAEIESHVDTDAYTWHVEQKVARDMGTAKPLTRMDGTADLVGVAKEGGWRGKGVGLDEPRLIIADFKMGRVPVEIANNRQLLAYAVLLMCGEEDWAPKGGWQDHDQVRLMIIQPAMAEVGAPVVKKGKTTYARVRGAAEWFDRRIDMMADEAVEVVHTPTADNCRFCHAARNGECPQVVLSLSNAEERIVEFGLIPPSSYEDFLRRCDLVAEMAKHVRADAQRRLERGEDVDGMKLVPGRQGNRRWTTPVECERELRDMGDHGRKVDILSEPALKSPAVLEREFRACGARASLDVIHRHYERGPANVTVAYEDDKRQTLGAKRIQQAIDHFSGANTPASLKRVGHEAERKVDGAIGGGSSAPASLNNQVNSRRD